MWSNDNHQTIYKLHSLVLIFLIYTAQFIKKLKKYIVINQYTYILFVYYFIQSFLVGKQK